MSSTGPYRWIAGTLRWGSYLSALLLAVGVVWVALDPSVPIQVGPGMPFRILGEQLATGNPYAIMQLGLLVLLATPLLRVVVAAGSFWRRKEWRYTVISLLVLLSVLISVLLSGGR